MRNKTILIAIGLILIPSLAYAGFWDDLKSFFGNFWQQEQKIEQPKQELGATIVYPYQGGTGTSTVPGMGDLFAGGLGGIWAKIASSTAYSLLTVSSTAPYGLGWSTQIGASDNRLDAFLDDLDATTLTIGGTASGDLDMGNYDILNANQIKANYFNATSTTATSTFSGGLTAGNNAAFVVNQAASANSLYVATNGRIGIGTSTPSANLHVYQSSPNANQTLFQVGTSDATTRFSVDEDGDVYLPDNTSSILIKDNTFIYGGRMYVSTGASGTAYGLRTQDYGLPSSPRYSAYAIDVVDGSNVVYAGILPKGGAVFNEQSLDTDFRIEGDNEVNLFFVDASTDRVGIGTNAPRYKLDVFGDLVVGTSTGAGVPADYPLLYVNSGEGGTNNGVGIGTTTVSGTMLTVGTTTPALVVSQNGNVGIGTTEPGSKLTVFGGDLKVGDGVATSTILNGSISLDYGLTAATSTITATSTVGSLAVGTSNLYVSENGRVGIGIVAPAIPLHIIGAAGTTVAGGSPSHNVRIFDSTALAANVGSGIFLGGIGKTPVEYWSFAALKSYKDNGVNDNVAGGLIFYTIDNTTRYLEERVRIDSDGNVGIGTTTPAMSLDTAGMIRAYKTSTSTCNATIEGGIFFNQTDKIFWGCNGTNWIRLDQ